MYDLFLYDSIDVSVLEKTKPYCCAFSLYRWANYQTRIIETRIIHLLYPIVPSFMYILVTDNPLEWPGETIGPCCYIFS